MSKNWWWLLAIGLTACGQQVKIAPDVALKHQYDAAFQQQMHLLQAEQVRVSATNATGGTGPAVLTLEVVNPHNPPEQHPDTLKQRMRKLAHLLVVDLASPTRYQALTAQATFGHSFFSKDNSTSSQAFIYPVAGLR